jgi:hypothetical protein
MMPRLVTAALAMLLFTAHIAAAQPATPIAPGRGVLEGAVTRGPLAPLAREGIPNSAPVFEAKIDIADSSGKLLMTVQSDPVGKYSVQLPPGDYLVSVASPKSPFGKHTPEPVTITAGHHAHLDLQVDTGIR